jgi:uncharacterized protein
MTQPAKAQEPSMEEILASIRRIIADDDASKAAQKAAEPPKPPAPPPRSEVNAAELPSEKAPDPAVGRASLEEQASDILDLTESMAAPSFGQPDPKPEPAPHFRKIEGHSDVGFADPVQTPPARPIPEQLISSATTAAVDSAFNALAQTVLVQNARTLEDLVREMLRPMLKSWLDDNLPGMVERLVRAEIERVARGR